MPTASRAGRGAAAIALAKIYFVLAGLVVQFALPRLLGSPARYGLFQSVLAGVSIFNNVMIAATVQTVSKLVSESEESARATIRRALGLQFAVGLACAGGLALAAGPIGERMFDPRFTDLLRIASTVVLSYAVYATLVGALNGSQHFAAQASFDAGFTTLRTVALCVGAGLFGVMGAVSGFAIAASTITLAALVVVGLGGVGEAPDYRRFLRYMAPIWIYQTLLNLLLQLDTVLIKGQLTQIAIDSGIAVAEAVDRANSLTGYYKAAQNFAFVPYQLAITATLVVFPMVSRATASGDDDDARAAIRNAGRFTLIALVLMAAPITGAADGVLGLLYAPEYVVATNVLRILSPALVLFTLFTLGATILAGAGRPVVAAGVAALSVAVMVPLDLVAFRIASPTIEALVALSIATASAMAIAAVAAISLVVQRFGTFIPLASTLRVLGAGAVAATLAYFVPHTGKVMTLVALTAGASAYLVILLVSGELGDLVAMIRRRLGRG